MDMNVTWIDINGNKKHLTSREQCKIPVSFWSWNHDKKWINVSKNLSKKLWNPFLTLQKLFSRKANSSWITAKSCFAKGSCCKSYKAAQIQGPWGHSYSKMRVYLLTWRSRRQMLMFGSCKKTLWNGKPLFRMCQHYLNGFEVVCSGRNEWIRKTWWEKHCGKLR